MKIIIGRHAWTAIRVWVDPKQGRIFWLSSAGRQHSRPLKTKMEIWQ